MNRPYLQSDTCFSSPQGRLYRDSGRKTTNNPSYNILRPPWLYNIAVVFVDINLSYIFLLAVFVVGALFLFLCFLKGKAKGVLLPFIGDALRYLCIQGLISLVFLLCYAFFIKNGFSPPLSDMGVAFIPLCVLAYMLAWRYGALSPCRSRLWLPLAYSLFLLYRFFTAGGGLSFFRYLVFNPAFGFIGNLLTNSPLRPLGAIGALVPLFCALIGRGLALKMIDNRQKM